MIMLTASEADDVKIEALNCGATDFLSKSLRQLELSIRLRNIVELAGALRKLDDHVASQAKEIEAATQALLLREEEMIFSLSKALEYRDNDTNDHTYRVALYSRLIAERLGMSARECRAVFLASPLHDIGKVGIPDRILLKPQALDDDERMIVRSHSAVGARILSGSQSELVALAAKIAECHHERWDGEGYPSGLVRDAIPLPARIVAAADVFDALTTRRPYKNAMPLEEAIDVMRAERGRHFDPACIDVFIAGVVELSGEPPSLATLRRRLDERYSGAAGAATDAPPPLADAS
jgi:putative two-component system response regulator